MAAATNAVTGLEDAARSLSVGAGLTNGSSNGINGHSTAKGQVVEDSVVADEETEAAVEQLSKDLPPHACRSVPKKIHLINSSRKADVGRW